MNKNLQIFIKYIIPSLELFVLYLTLTIFYKLLEMKVIYSSEAYTCSWIIWWIICWSFFIISFVIIFKSIKKNFHLFLIIQFVIFFIYFVLFLLSNPSNYMVVN